ncbi:MAG: class I SAM-dependent methyltransferase [bacterium]
MGKTRCTKLTTCLLCGPVQTKIVAQGSSFGCPSAVLVRCPHCNLWWIDPLPSPSRIQEFYPPEYYGIHNEKFHESLEAFVQLFCRLRTERAAGLPLKRKRALDIGCGRGQSLKILQKNGYESYGTELSPFSARAAASIPGVRIFTQGLLDCHFPNRFFDLVIVWHVLEHLPNPAEVLREIFRILTPGGVLLLCVPNIESIQARLAGSNWFHLDLPRHLYQYNPFALTRLLTSVGFCISRYHTFSIEQGPFGLLQSILNIIGFPRDGLYRMLHRTWTSGQDVSFFSRLVQTELFLFSMPFMIWICSFLSLLGQGGVIDMQAHKPVEQDPAAI